MQTFRFLFILSTSVFLFSCSPKEGLDIKDDVEFKLVQRGSKVIKGSEGDVELILDDITGGETEVAIENIESGEVYFKKYMDEGESTIFKYGSHYYRVKINYFELHTFSSDYAFMSFREVSEEKGKSEVYETKEDNSIEISPEEIRAYLSKVKNSGLSFIRNDQVLPDTTMASWLESKYIINQEDIKTDNDFIKKVVTVSYVTGENYQVILEEGDTLNLLEWLDVNGKITMPE